MKEVYEANPPACARTEVALSGTGTTKFALRLTLAAALFCFSVLGMPSAFATNGGDDLTCDIAYAGAPPPPPPFPPLPPGSIVVCLNGLGQTNLNASLLGPFTTTSNPSCTRVRVWTADPDDPDGADNILGNADDPQEVVVGHPLYTRTCANISAGVGDYTEVWVTREIFQQGVDPCRSSALPFRIYIADCTRPTLACPPAKTYTCANEQIAANPPALMTPAQFSSIGGTVSDNCTVNVTYSDGPKTDTLCANKYRFVRTFTATDQSRNTRTCTQLITVSDETPPVFLTPPANLTLQCQNYANFPIIADLAVQAWLISIGGATYSDNCGDPILPGILFCLSNQVGCAYSAPLFAATVRDHMPSACSPLPREVEVVFTIQDACGNETSASAKIILIDSQAPTLFDSNGPLPGGQTWTTSGLNILGDGGEGGPYDCINLIPPPNPESVRPHVTDNCTPQEDLTIVWVSDVPATVTGCGSPYDVITRTYQVDDCDPTTPSLLVTQEIRIKDDVAPFWTNNPNTVTLSCTVTDQRITDWLNNHGDDGAASDLCNTPVTITNNTTASALIANLRNWCPSSASTRSQTVTFTATDACGNTSTSTAVITLFDLEGPTASNPANVTVSCVADITQDITDVLDATDNCSGTVTVTTLTPQVIVNGTGCKASPIIIRQRYQLADCANNTSVVSRLVTVQDTILPTWTVDPTPLTIACDDPGNEVTLIQNWLTANGNGTATDNCSDVLYSTSPNTVANVFAALQCAKDTGYTTIVTFVASDSCGNTVSRTARVTLTDNTAPTATATPANYNCVEDLPAYNIGVVTGISDNCATLPQITVVARPDLESNNGGDGCADDTLKVFRRYQITDCTGNSAIVTQTITVVDNVKPTANCKPDTVDLGTDGTVTVNASQFDNSSADNCAGSLVLEFSRDELPLGVTSIPDGPYTTSKVFTCADIVDINNCNAATNNAQTIAIALQVIDSCGNANICNTWITVRDVQAPAFPVIADVTVTTSARTEFDCKANVTITPPQITENCTIACYTMQVEKEINNAFVTINPATGFATPNFRLQVSRDIDLDYVFEKGPKCAFETPMNPDDQYRITFYTRDEHGNADTVSYIITVKDDEAPLWEKCPQTIIADVVTNDCYQVKCWERPLPYDNCMFPVGPCDTPRVVVTASDPTVMVNFIQNSATDCAQFPIGTTEVYYTATDACGNVSTCTITVEISDTQAPTAKCIGSPVTINLEPDGDTEEPASFFDLGSTDNCVVCVIEVGRDGLFGDKVIFTCADVNTTVLVTLRVADCSPIANEATCTVAVNIEDMQQPGIAQCPADITVGTDADVCNAVVTYNTPLFNDGCGNPKEGGLVQGLLSSSTFPIGNTVVSYSYTSPSGFTVYCNFNVTVEDDQAPTLVCPSNVADLTCNTALPAPFAINNFGGTITDNCGVTLLESSDYDNGFSSCPNDGVKVITRTYTAWDAAGNTSVCSQSFTYLEDATAPVFSPASLSAVNGTCAGEVPVAPTVTAADGDGCGGVTINFNETITSLSGSGAPTCPNKFVVTRTWVASDICGNRATLVQVITINDDENPVLTSRPLNETHQCAAAVSAPPTIGATDNCGSVTVTFSETTDPGPTSCPNSFIIRRTWLATDACGNTDVHTQTITVNDTTNPVLSSKPADATVSCAALVPAVVAVTATDNCGVVNVDFSETTVPQGCENKYQVVRRWVATDACGNVDSHTQTITVNDTEAPAFSNVQASISVICAALVPAVSQPMATDNCGVATVDFAEYTVPGDCPNSYTVIRRWVASDLCGNRSTTLQTIVVNDQIAPTFNESLPGGLTVSCAQEVPAAAVLTATDNCDGAVQVIYSEELRPGDCPNQFSIVRTWTAEDLCGNLVKHVQTIIVSDIQAPVWNEAPAANVSTDCAENVTAAPVYTATDNCGIQVVVDYSEEFLPGTCANRFMLIRRWKAQDDCGNVVTRSQTVTVNDVTQPNWVETTLPANYTADCAEAVNTAEVLTATDNCGAPLNVEFYETTDLGTCPNDLVVKRRWYVQDDCGNSREHIQTITILDTQAPVWNEQAPAAVVNGDCADDVPLIPAQTATDNCNRPVDVEFSESIYPGLCTNSFTIIRRWTAEDDCGNITSREQVITINDNVAPVLANLPAATVLVDCAEKVPAVAPVTVSDNCGTVVDFDFTEVEVPGTCPNQYQIVRTWTAVDVCGNATSFVQTITISDTQAPTWTSTLPANASLACGETIPAAATLTASDNCGAPVDVEFNETWQPGAGPNDGNTLVRTWTAEDDCGNAISYVQTITVNDVTAPVLANLPQAFVNVSCSEQVPAVAAVTVSDNCQGTIDFDFTEVEVPGTCPNQYSITRTWTAVDFAGNATSFVQTITISDTQAPVLSGLPTATVGVSCSEQVPAVPTVSATDNCGAPVDVDFFEVEVPGTCPNQYSITRTWTAADDCGNIASFVQTINISDIVAPVLAGLPTAAFVNVSCSEQVPQVPNVTATDNCGAPVDLEFSEVEIPGTCPNQYSITRTWSAEDDCGNIASFVQVITINDVTAPVLANLPAASVSVSCAEQVPAVAGVTATDNCNQPVDLEFSEVEVPGTCPNQYQIRRTWTAEDDCGNAVSFVQTISINDSEAPVFAGLPAASVAVTCSESVPAVAIVTASDNCNQPVDIEFSEVEVPGTCPNQYQIRRTWTAEDDCGNIVSFVQTISINDNQAPVMVGLPVALVNVSCSEQVPTVGIVVATDNCNQPVDIEFFEVETPGTCPNQYIITRTWSAEDDCGNITSFVQTIVINDNQAPIMTGLPVASVSVSCSEQVPQVAIVVATDNCNAPVDVEFSEVEIPGTCPNQYAITRTWTAEDDCGNITSFVQTITINDTQAPVLNGLPLASVSVSCSEQVPAVPTTVTASDNCNQPVDLEFSEVEVPGTCPNQYQIRRTWTAEDDCGNATSFVQTITVNDTQAPTWTSTLPGNLTLNCGEAVPAAATLTASDNCNQPVDIELSETWQPGAGPNDGNVLVRTWTAEDDCGNAISHVQTITVNDLVAPVLGNLPAATVSVSCSEQVPAVANVTASDNCLGTVDVEFSEVEVPGTCPNQYGITRTWTAVDFAGNATSFVQTITISDTQAPVLSGLPTATVSVSCSEQVPAVPTVSATDNCGAPVDVEFSEVEVPGTCPNQYGITRTWTAEDDCGNITSFVQTITISDTQAPVLSGLPTATVGVSCSEQVPAVASVSATDNCGAPVDVEFSEVEVPGTCPNQYQIRRTWTAEDDCGNATSFVQTITISDTQAPVLSGLPTATVGVSCSEQVPAVPAVSATDNCGAPVDVEFSEVEIPGTCPNQYSITRTWTAEDDCGNATSFVQTITISDTQAPVLAGLPAASVRFSCSEQVPAVAAVTATDNCGAPVDVEFFEVEAPGTCPNQYSITRTWTAEDDCGNITSFVQTITIEDLQAPVFAGLPAASVSVSCSEQVPAVANVTATDNCNQPVDIELSEIEIPGTCPNQYQIRRTWTAEDDCGNAVSFVQTITISDTQAPVWTSTLPGNLSLNCGEAVPAAATLTASDNCNQPVDIELSETWQPGAGPNDGNVLVRTWTAQDDCGNAISHVQTITVNDLVAPVLANLPAATVSVSCSEQVPAVANVTATDNCQGTIFVQFNEVEVPGTCPNQYQVRRTWSAIDFAGNSTSFVQTITISDTQAPVFAGLPTASVTVSCSEQVPAVASVSATDNCGAPVDVEFSEVEVPGTCPNQYGITRTWTAEDDCGNITSFVQTITISDNQVPVLSNLPAASVSVSCSEQVPAVAAVTATDNCNQPVDLEFSEVEIPGTCPNQYAITRTWTAEDDCGNITSFVQTITISDTQAPVLSNLPTASVSVSCAEQVPAVANVTATDNCNQPVDLEFSEVEVPGTCPNQYQIVRTWTAEDDCGNAVSFVQTITISDTQAPAFVGTLPTNFTLSCGETVPAAPVLTATDNCNQPVDVEFNETYLPGAGPNDNATMVRTWTAEDDCGNIVSHVQTITINDVAAPVFAGLPAASVNVSCASAVPAVANVTASDNCQGAIVVTFSEVEVSGGCPNRFTLTRTWTAVDLAGNATSFVQTINVNDNVAPVVSCPAPLTAQCSVDERPVYANLSEFNLAGGSASDNCGLSINDFGMISQTNVGNVFTRTYRVTDQCGNAATCAQTITVLDTQAPVFLNCPTGPVVVGNDADKCSAKVNWGIPVAVDNCGNPTVAQISGPTSGSILAVGNYTVVYRATDAAGNNVQCSFGVQVMDTQAPEFDADITMPNDTTVQCNSVPTNCVYHGPLVCTPLTNADVSDNCGTATVSFAETSTQCSNQAQCCFYNYTVTRRWTATDAAGNTRVHTQVITVVDNTKPTAVCKNFTLTLDKFGVATLTPANINNGSFDNCAPSQFLTLSLSKTSFNCSNLGANTVTLTVTDPCGNFGTCNATVTVVEGEGSCTPQFNVATSCKDNATNLDNGQFVDLITVKALAGQTWTISGNTGLFSNNSPNPPVAPTALPVGTQLIMGSADGINNDGDGQTDEADEMVYYTIRGIHVDGIGYNIGLSNNIGQTATISNRAYYPTPIFLNLDGPFCLSTPPFTIQVGETFGAAGTVTSIRVNGVATNTFNAGQLGIGFHTVEAIFDAGAATTNLVINGVLVGGTNDQAIADPGCKQIITKSVQVIGTPTTVACNDVIHVSLDADCQETITPDMVLEGSYFCYDDYSVIITYPTGTATFTPPNRVNATHIGKTIMFSLRHILSGNLCWGTIIVEDKLAPVVSCPSNRTILCTQNEDNLSLTGTPIVDDCSAFTTVREDQYQQFSCAQNNTVFTRVSRLWVATDAWGNKDSCTQFIDILRGTVDQVNFPADVEYVCTNVPASLQPGTTGWPTIAGVNLTTSGTGACGLAVSFSDEFAQVCPGSYKIIRTWKVNDWCSPGTGGPSSKEFIQFIKVTDVAPTVDFSNFTYDADNDWYVINTNAIINGQCVSAGPIPTAIFNGVCNQVVDVKVTTPLGPISNGGLLPQPGLGLGVHNITYVLTDECGNITSITIKVNVIDNTPPAISCDEFTQVALGGSGVSEVFAETFDDGTYDNCCLDGFLVRRMVDGECDNDDLEDDFADRVVFCCADINDTVTVVLRAFDCYGNHNDCMVSVFVEDKIKPACSAPANVTVSCENFDPSLWAYGMPSAVDNCCVDTITTTVNIAQFDTLCNKGTIVRTFRAFDCAGQSSQCTQRIVVQYEQDYFVRFPNDVIVTNCNGTPNFGEPTFFGEDCELLAVSFTDEVFTVVPDACYKIERVWRIINWCTFNPNLPVVSVPNPNPNAIANNPANLTGPIVSAPGSTAPWTSIPLALLPGQAPHDFTQYYTGNPAAGIPSIANSNGFSYKQIIKVIDNKAPVFANCPSSPVTINDLSGNDPLLWNKMYYWDNSNQSHDLCEGTVDLSVAITDSCGGSDVTVKYLLFLDLDNSGDMETVVSSTNIPAANTVFFGNANNPNFTGGTAYNFDDRPVALNQKYRFNIDVVKSGNTATAKLIWDTPQVPANLNDAAMQGVAPQLPYGTHKIKWITNDGCGNEAVCEYLIVVRDGKAPTVVCLNGLSVNIMPTQMITLFASDFLQYTEDNCSPATLLDIAIVESDESTGSFPVDGQGNPLTTVNFNCQEVGTQPVQLWSRDVAGNADYCETYVIVQDPNNFCGSDPISVAGDLKTETQNGLEDASVEMIGTHPALPPVSMFDMTNNDGAYAFSNALPISANYSVTPLKDDNHLNGVTTFDLVLISKHILGLEPLGSPYKMIAADANKSNSITTFDIVELRKLILGIYTELPNNTSWRFVDKSYNFANPNNPFTAQFPEFKSVADVQASQMNDDFVSLKVGDVNGSAIANSLMSADDRTVGTLLFDVEDRQVKAGEEFTVNFTATEQVLGYQFTMNLKGLEVVDIVPGAGMDVSNFGLFNDAITTSFDGKDKGAFALKFRAKTSGQLSNMLGVSSRITKAEAYKNDVRLDVAFRFNGSTIAGVGFELYQNTPNPFINKTMIGFHLPEATEATITIFDEAGRMIFTQTGDFGKGYNAVTLDREMVNTTGLLYYKLETATDSATKKMIQTK